MWEHHAWPRQGDQARHVSYSFDITPLTAATIGPAFTIMHSDVQALQDAQDPTAYFTNGSGLTPDKSG
jgi:hypothetical protein